MTSILLFLLFILFVPVIITLVIYFIGLWKFFQKCGYQGWEAIVPFYNSWILIKISGLNSWYYLLLMANIILGLLSFEGLVLIGQLASLVASFFIYYNISKKFHKDMFFTVLMFLFSFVMIPILGFKKDNVYDSNVKVSPNGPIGDNDFNNSSNSFSGSNNYNENVFYCRHCGCKLESKSNFCKNCGSKINEE